MVPTWLIWTIIGIVAAIVLAVIIYFIVKIVKMKPEERKEVIMNFLMGLVTTAENLYVEHGMGKEKIEEVQKAFEQTAPWFLKILLAVTKSADLNDLIEQALTKVKETWGKQEEDEATDKVV